MRGGVLGRHAQHLQGAACPAHAHAAVALTMNPLRGAHAAVALTMNPLLFVCGAYAYDLCVTYVTSVTYGL